jgi:hypothetical protein
MRIRRQSAANATGTGTRISPESSHRKENVRRRNTRARKVSGAGGAFHLRSIDLNSSSFMFRTPKRFQHAPQIVARTVQSCLHSSDLAGNRMGRFFESQPFILNQDQYLSLQRRERMNRLGYLLLQTAII